MTSIKRTVVFFAILAAFFSVVIKGETYFGIDIEKNNTIYDSNESRDFCEDIICYYGRCIPEIGICSCNSGYSGNECEIFPKSECKNQVNLCAETGGICKIVDNNGNIACVCPHDSKFVEKKGCLTPAEVHCLDFPCYNGGICSWESEKTRCYCLEGYSGDHCEIFPAYECKKKYKKCIETDGQCISIAKHDIICECPEDTTFVPSIGCKGISVRDTSESSITELVETFRSYTAVVGSIMGLLLVLLMIIAVIFYRKLKKNRNNHCICAEHMIQNAPMEDTGNEESENVYSEVNLQTIYKNENHADQEISRSAEKTRNKTIHTICLSGENNANQALQGRNLSSKTFHNHSNVHQQSGSKELNTIHIMQYDNNAYDV